MADQRNSKNSCPYKVILRIHSSNVQIYYNALRPDDVPVKDLEYSSTVDNSTLRYVFVSNNILKIRTAVDDILEKLKLTEEVIKKSLQASE
ncbi:hypothetical protein EYM_03535 [Ignicoccus islandicus DSM 13165]|uniref:KEOPS complex Pcc1-like subunit n=1 Tax=Ignicoccus islandicus DSM 13165 TaxID=940295 RepID=A0A0U3EDB6_9CREN|nr:hypothetical protein EYM_03535 [Ignicoccus islandicus DSM 13165]